MHVGRVHNNKPMWRSHISNHKAMVVIISVQGDYTKLPHITLCVSATSIVFVQGAQERLPMAVQI